YQGKSHVQIAGSGPVQWRKPLRRRRTTAHQEIGPMKFARITASPTQMGGVPCIRGLRIPVATVMEMLADGMTSKEILGALPDLEAGDIDEALRFAADAVRERELPLIGAGLLTSCPLVDDDRGR